MTSHGAKAWMPGEVDCLLALADWQVCQGRNDPAAHLRGTYDSEAGYKAIIRHAGGVVPLVEGIALESGMKPLAEPVLGAVGIVGSRANGNRQWGGIWDGLGWRVRFVNDYPRVSAHALAIWN